MLEPPRTPSDELSPIPTSDCPFDANGRLYDDPGAITMIIEAEMVTIHYCNYRGDVSDRNITPRSIRFGHTEWHPDDQWLLEAFDHDKLAERSFAMKDILSWKTYGRETGDV